jgi:hypothetical protein
MGIQLLARKPSFLHLRIPADTPALGPQIKEPELAEECLII